MGGFFLFGGFFPLLPLFFFFFFFRLTNNHRPITLPASLPASRRKPLVGEVLTVDGGN